MSALRKSLFISCGLVLFLLLIASQLSKEYIVVRSITVNATPKDVHKLVADLNYWDSWSPWKDSDETMKVVLGEKTTGVGASQTWTGRDGAGSLHFTSVEPDHAIRYTLRFGAVDESEEATHASVEIRYERANEALNQSGNTDLAGSDGSIETLTNITWRMTGTVPAPIAGGIIAKMMDKMVGSYFVTGLERLKKQVESSPKSSG